MNMEQKDKELAEMIRNFKTSVDTSAVRRTNENIQAAIAGAKNIKFDATPIARCSTAAAEANAQVKATNEKLNRAVAQIRNKT